MISMRRLRAGSSSEKAAGASSRPSSRRCSSAREGVTIDSAYTVAAAALPPARLAFAATVGRLARTNPDSWTHPEGWRDWPCEAPATTGTSRREGANSRQMCGGSLTLRHTVTAKTDEREPAMAVSHLECKECKATYPLEALYVCERCFGPLEAAYRYGAARGDVGELRRRIEGGPQNTGRYADVLPLHGGPSGPSG